MTLAGDLAGCPTAIVGGFLADGSTPDGNGIVYTVADLQGWWDSPSMRQATLEVQPFGEVITVARTNGRAIVLTITAHSPDGNTALGAPLCWTAIGVVQTTFAALYVPITLEIIDPLNDNSADVRLVGSIRKQILGQSAAVKFLIPLLAPDPTFV